MTERPILFSGQMVRAILEGRKTQTRRVMKEEVNFVENGMAHGFALKSPKPIIPCPYGKPGEHLWVRETWGTNPCYDYLPPHKLTVNSFTRDAQEFASTATKETWVARWRPSIHMPRWASRLTLEITGIRVERLQEIRAADAIAEGIEICSITDDYSIHGGKTGKQTTHYKFYGKELERLKQQTSNPRWSYETLWDSINEKRGFGWKTNPWVWVIEFKKLNLERNQSFVPTQLSFPASSTPLETLASLPPSHPEPSDTQDVDRV